MDEATELAIIIIILEKIEGDSEMHSFNYFSTKLTHRPFISTEKYRSAVCKRTKLWSIFHQLRISELP